MLWVTNGQEADLLRRVFGGQIYPHKSRQYWILTKRKEQLELAELLRDHPECSERLAKLYAYEQELAGV